MTVHSPRETLNVLAVKLLGRAAERRKTLCEDVVSDALDEFVDAINDTIRHLDSEEEEE